MTKNEKDLSEAMQRNPRLVQLFRGEPIESWHHGAVAVADGRGKLLMSLGDIDARVFPRSTAKLLQAIPSIETGAVDRMGFGVDELAVSCASHTGTRRHVELVSAMLAKAGLSTADLACGPHPPGDVASQAELAAAGEKPTRLRNACSGKHAAMLATAVTMGEPVAHYEDRGHPVQQRVAAVLGEFLGRDFDAHLCGIDGCSVPTWSVPLGAFAQGMARFVSGEGLSQQRATACRRILLACMTRPELVSGPDQFCSQVTTRTQGDVFMKMGVEGIYLAIIASKAIAVAVKIDDGADRAAQAVMATIIGQLVLGDEDALANLYPRRQINWAGTEVGALLPTEALRNAVAHIV